MSVTLVVVPASIGSQVVLGLITSLIASTAASEFINRAEDSNLNNYANNSFSFSNKELIEKQLNKQYKTNQDFQTICSQYKTVFKDGVLLIKTLKEHGVENIETQDDKIYCSLEALQFEFEKNSEGVYIMNITHKKHDNLEIVKELSEEYQTNVQEQSYINLKKKLENQNLEIDSEEILEDNSIMITVNLE